MKRFEAFINWQNDMTWGPFERMRPPKDVNIRGRRFGLLCGIGAAATMAVMVPVLCAITLAFYYAQYRQLPPLAAVGAMPVRLISRVWWLLLAAGAVFPLAMWPYFYCWNKRAQEIRRNPAPSQLVEHVTVWPPPPRLD